VDKKIRVIYDNYKDNFYVKTAQKEVEDLRNRAVKLGAGISSVAFIANEFARLSMRSPLFKLRAQNVAFWLVAPTFMTKKALDNDVEKRVEQMWRVHKNRTEAGLGPTWAESGFHESMEQDMNFKIPNSIIHTDEIFDGAIHDI
jgi:hypothetical protein